MDVIGMVVDFGLKVFNLGQSGLIEWQAWLTTTLTGSASLTNLQTGALSAGSTLAAIRLPSRKRAKHSALNFKSVQEHSGFHLEISKNLDETGKAATAFFKSRYDAWLERGWAGVDTRFKCEYFCVAVGGGHTMKAQYRALLKEHACDIDWLEHVHFFFLEESSGEKTWESSRLSLILSFITPLATRLVEKAGQGSIATQLGLQHGASVEKITQALIEKMTHPIDVDAIGAALKEGNPELARKLSNKEATRYRKLIQSSVGDSMAFHIIVSGIARDGGIGAFPPYHPTLKKKTPGVVVLEQDSGALRIALNRGVFTNAERVSLIISGTMKLNALGRFEMDDSAPFEQTVMETPLRMLRENEAIAEKVYVFADDEALHFAEGMLKFTEGKKHFKVRAEVREGLEPEGVHILLVHGFMGLYSHINLIIKLPSKWEVSALHRGKKAKKLPEQMLFPHYALCLRKALLKNWRKGRPTPICCHSMGGIISDHLLLATVGYEPKPLPEFEDLAREDQAVIEALRASGNIHLAAWSPIDIVHLMSTAGSLAGYLRRGEQLDYSGPPDLYDLNIHGGLQFNESYRQTMIERPTVIETLLRFPGTEYLVNAFNITMRYLLSKKDLQQTLSNREIPYGLRVIGERLLRKISLYGILKEINSAVHEPYVYIDRHLKALEVILKYDIPFLSIIHKDDFIVSASRHQQEYDYLLGRRMAKEGVEREEDLQVNVRLLLLEREQDQLPLDTLNPHLMVMSVNREGDRVTREVTQAMTRFVNENVARAIDQGNIRPLASVAKWRKKNKHPPQRCRHQRPRLIKKLLDVVVKL